MLLIHKLMDIEVNMRIIILKQIKLLLCATVYIAAMLVRAKLIHECVSTVKCCIRFLDTDPLHLIEKSNSEGVRTNVTVKAD